ncbi:hypothetical protein HA466_0017520 [Hirschfeldia incana]|nr:hypothetical protein HA466_0017520 [Hirschfeldia incana]
MMIVKSVFSKYARVRCSAISSSGRSEGRAFSSLSHPPPKDTSAEMTALFIATFIGGSTLYCVTDIVKYIIHRRRLSKIEEECKELTKLSREKTERILGVPSIFKH